MAKLLTILVLLAPLGLAACGDDGDGEPATVSGSATTNTEATESTTTSAATEPDSGDHEEDAAAQPANEGEAAVELPTSVSGVVETVLTGSLPAATICDELLTPKLVKTAYGAREGCLAAEKPGAQADSVEQVSERESAGSASVTVIPSGGPYDGVEVEVELVAAGDSWQVDSLLADVPAGP